MGVILEMYSIKDNIYCLVIIYLIMYCRLLCINKIENREIS